MHNRESHNTISSFARMPNSCDWLHAPDLLMGGVGVCDVLKAHEGFSGDMRLLGVGAVQILKTEGTL